MNIAIKLPNTLKGLIHSFPFLHGLNKQLEAGSKLHLITASNELEVLNLLPFEAYFHELDPADSSSAVKILRAHGNSKLVYDRFDCYVSTTTDKADSVLGFLTRAKRRIGFQESELAFLFKEKVPYLKGRDESEQIFKLLAAFSEVNENNIPCVSSRSFKLDKDIDSYFVMDSEVLKDETWLDFMHLFDEQHIMLWGESEHKFNYTECTHLIDFGKLAFYSEGVITANPSLALLACYVGVNCFYLGEQKLNPYYFKGPLYSEPLGDGFDYGRTFDRIYEQLPAIIKSER